MSKSFRDIEIQLGVALPESDSALDQWYRAVRDVPIEQLSVSDLCIAVRQALWPDYVIPVAVRWLRADALVGDRYDGELLSALRATPAAYWRSHLTEAQEIMAIIASLGRVDDPDLARDIQTVQAAIAG